MTWNEVLDHARSSILNCKACPECNGLACGNTLPGPGSKAPGNGANDNWRALADVPATAEVLPEIVQAVHGQAAVIVDGGIRHGVDMVKALCLGADAVMICRPFAVAWFGGEADGVKTYIEMLRSELSGAMYMVGARKLSDLNPDMVR